MKKLVVLSLSLLSLTFNVWSLEKNGTSMVEIDLNTASIPPIEPTTKENQAAKRGLFQRFKQSKFVPGGDNTRAVGSAIASPFKAIGRSVQNSYGTLKGKSSTLKRYVNKNTEDTLESRPVDYSDGRSKTEKAKIIALKGLAGAAAPFHAAGQAIGKGAVTAGDAIKSRAVTAGDAIKSRAVTAGKAIGRGAKTAGDAIGKIFKRNRHSSQSSVINRYPITQDNTHWSSLK